MEIWGRAKSGQLSAYIVSIMFILETGSQRSLGGARRHLKILNPLSTC